MFGFVAALGLPGIFSAGSNSRLSLGYCRNSAAYGSLLTVFVTERYRLAAVPGLLFLRRSAFGDFGQSWSLAGTREVRRISRRWRWQRSFVSVPQKELSLWALDPYNSGWQAWNGRISRWPGGNSTSPTPTFRNNAEVNFARGNLSLERRRPKCRAGQLYRRPITLDGKHEGAWNNLGVLALEENEWNLAATFFAKALEQDREVRRRDFFLRAPASTPAISQAQKAICIEPWNLGPISRSLSLCAKKSLELNELVRGSGSNGSSRASPPRSLPQWWDHKSYPAQRIGDIG